MATTTSTDPAAIASPARNLGRLALGAALAAAGITHLTVARQEFRAQVPAWFPLDEDLVVVASGLVEIGLGGALLVVPRRLRPVLGVVAAAFFIAIFPGNVAQWRERVDAFGLDTDTKRFVRLFFQPVLVVLALWSTRGTAWLARRLGRPAGR